MEKFKIILTSDYEVWGNGSGCVERCVINPASQILDIAEKFNAPVTFFFDVCEYWAFEQVEKNGGFQNDYRPASLMRNQLQEAVKRNHDVQLHFHPQWLNYRFISNQSWKLDYRYWRLSKVNDFHNSDWNLEKLFSKGKETLEGLFKEIKPDYKVNVFRAGAWCIQPEKEVLKAMKASGILLDSTVAPGLSYNDGRTQFNFSKSPTDRSFWPFSDDIQISDSDGSFLEVPITTTKVSLPRRIIYLLLKYLQNNARTPEKCDRTNVEGKNDGIGKIGAIKKVLVEKYRMLNFSDAITADEMIHICKKVMDKYKNSKLEEIPIVAISHPKTFGNSEQFERFMSWLNNTESVSFGTFQEIINKDIK